MKLRIYILKKQQLIWAAVILAAIIISLVLVITLKTKNTVNTINSKNTIRKYDINNDGKRDSIEINIDEKTQKYMIDVISSDGNGYTLEPDPSIKSLGCYSSSWPLNVTVKDINDDNSVEIVLQSSDKIGPILHVFKYSNGKMERIASGRYSIFGTLKDPSFNGTMAVLGYKKGDRIQFRFLGTSDGRYIPVVSQPSMTLGSNILSSVITYIEKKDVEAISLNIQDKYANNILKGTFLDARLTDTKYTKYSIPTDCTYVLRTNSPDSNKNEVISYKVKLSLAKFDAENPEYKIIELAEIK